MRTCSGAPSPLQRSPHWRSPQPRLSSNRRLRRATRPFQRPSRRRRRSRDRRATPTTRLPRGSIPASRELSGDQLLTWRNIASIPATSLRFHLYYNAWRNTRSTWIREQVLAGDTSAAERPESDWGWIDITSLKLVGTAGAPDRRHAEPALHRTRRRQRGRPHGCRGSAQRTRRAGANHQRPDRVDLASAENVRAHRAQSAATSSSRSGFPRSACCRTTAGTVISSMSGRSSSADFGVYDVRLTVPAGWIVGATGAERGRRDERRPNDDAQLLRRRRARLRLDDEPRLRRADSNASTSPGCRRWRCGCCCSPSTPVRRRATSRRRGPHSSTTASGSDPIHTRTSRSSIRRGRAAPAAWNTRRSSPPARAGSRRSGLRSPKA